MKKRKKRGMDNFVLMQTITVTKNIDINKSLIIASFDL